MGHRSSGHRQERASLQSIASISASPCLPRGSRRRVGDQAASPIPPFPNECLQGRPPEWCLLSNRGIWQGYPVQLGGLVNESTADSGCGSVFNTQTVVLANGLLQMADSTCQSELTSWSADTCEIESTTSCTSALIGIAWSLSLTDVMGDGSRLLGLGSISVSAPASCQAEAYLELIRQ